MTQKQLDEQITLAWKDLQELWDEVNLNKMDITEARKKWILPFFRTLGFKPVYQPQDIITSGDERLKFHISHRGFPEERDPMIHTVSPSEDLDVRNASDRNKKSPHDTIQIYLNVEKKAQWALLTNGIVLRILRDFYHTSTNGYVEFDLQNIFTDRSYSDFRALYRMVHASRFSKDKDGITSLEHFYKESLAAGVKVGEDLRGNVKKAIETLGNGFLTGDLAQRMISDEKFCKEYYEELLHMIYRILFLLFAEQRGMLPSRDSLYAEEYSITKLREWAENITGKDKHTDMWHGLKVTFRLLKSGSSKLKVFPYNGSLFDDERLKIISALSCRNEELLTAIRYLTLIEKDKVLQRISYLDLGVEEIGSIYESLLEFTPRVLAQNETVEGELINARTFFLDPRGTARKTTGSYYTNPLLVDELIKSALIPVVKKKMASGKTPLEMEKLLLSLKVCDLSCGSAAFLIAAVNYMGRALAKLRTGTEYPSDKEERRAKRDVLQHCIYGVDLNPMAVELAKVSLWINCVVEDMPLNFLDHHIKCGNSLIGTTPDLLLKGIPDEAFTPVEGDDKKVAKEIMSIHKVQKKSQSLVGWGIREDEKIDTDKFIKLSDLPEDKPEGVAKKEDCYNQLTKSYTYSHQKLIADAWTAAFFWPLTKETKDAPTQGFLRMLHESDSGAVDKKIVDRVKALAQEYRFFHWYLEFPEVFQREEAGFDCVIGNPPWDMIKENSDEFFSFYDSDYRSLNSKQKKERIKQLCLNTEIYQKWQEYEKIYSHFTKYYTNSGSYLYQGTGHFNAFKLFLERFHQVIAVGKEMGILIPSGIYTDEGCTDLRRLLFDHSKINSLFCFENKQKIFPIHSSFKFVILAAEKGGPTEIFNCGFMLHDLDMLAELTKNGLKLSVKLVKKFSPDTLSVMEFTDQSEVNLMEKIYKDVPLLGEKMDRVWNVVFHREINQTDDHELLQTSKTSLPIFEGKMIHHFQHLYEEPRYWLLEKDAINFYAGRNQTWKYYRLAYRAVASSTNETTLISTIIPKNTGSVESLRVIELFNSDNNKNKQIEMINSAEQCFLGSLMNSFIVNYITRRKISANLSAFYIYQLPIPRLISGNWYFDQLVPRAARLICTTEELADLWNEVYRPEWNKLSVNDGGTSKLFDWNILTPEWRKECGAYGWDETKHDIGDRAQLRCEIDALVAHLYGLNKQELDYILSTFPIVREKTPWLIEGTVREFERFGNIEKGECVNKKNSDK